MRQWLTDPKKMCLKHLLGEHVEHHMFVGALKKHKSMKGYLRNNLLEPKSLVARHAEIALEMESRGYNHKSPLEDPDLSYLTEEEKAHKINKVESQIDLVSRCPACKARSGF